MPSAQDGRKTIDRALPNDEARPRAIGTSDEDTAALSILTGFGLDLTRQCYVPGALVPHSVSRQITSNLIDRLNITLDAQSLTPAPVTEPETTSPPSARKPPTPSDWHPASSTPHPSERTGHYTLTTGISVRRATTRSLV